MRLIKVVIVVIILLLIFYLKTPSKKNDPKPVNTSASLITLSEISPDTNQGFTLVAKDMQTHEKFIYCNDVKCKFINNAKKVAHLEAKNTMLNFENKNISLKKNVTGKFEDFNLKGSNFYYNHLDQKLETNDLLTLSGKQIQVISNQTKVNLNNKEVFLSGNVKTKLYVSSSSDNGN